MKKKILIVEDEMSIKKALAIKLEEAGFEVFESSDGKEGLEMALETKPDLVLLDIIMPKMDGLTLLKHLRADKKGRNIPVIVLSNLNDEEKIEESIKNNIFDYLIKTDWKIEEVIEKVKARLEEKK